MISVLMSVYNEPLSFIEKAVESILKQSYENFELIIVIDDPNNKKAITFLNNSAEYDDRIHLIFNERNLGLVSSLNKAFKRSKGEYIARMDADDISAPDRLEKELKQLIELQVDLIGCNVKDITENGVETGKVTRFPVADENIKEYLKYDDCIPHPTWLATRKMYEMLNAYQNIDACEDYDFLIRGALRGFKFANIEKPLLKYRINGRGISATKKAKQKATLNFIRSKYKVGMMIDEKMCNEYFTSNKGQKELRSYQRYYKMSSKLKTINNRLCYYIYGMHMFLSSRKAREVIKNISIEKHL